MLVNSGFGEINSTVGSLVFQDSAGHSDTISLEEGVNIRDHYISFNNVATEVYGRLNIQGTSSSTPTNISFPLRSLATR